MRMLVTGGAGFIGRWVAARLLEDGHEVVILDNFANGSARNVVEFVERVTLVEGDVKDTTLLRRVFGNDGFDVCYHLAASINVQDSIDDPRTTFNNDAVGTFNVLEESRRTGTKVVFMSTCMVYDRATNAEGISEGHPTKPASPYAGSKISGEVMTLSYWHAYGLPVVVVRPFNTYGPYQKSSGEGGVVAVFIKRDLDGEDLTIYGDGTQTRDLLFVTDCADFVVRAGLSDAANGEIVNAGLGRDVSVNELAALCCDDPARIRHVPHIHPQSEIARLLCDPRKARRLMGWEPKVPLEEGLARTRAWIATEGCGR